jgi:phage protein D
MTLAIGQIEPARGNFYAPAFDVTVSGQSLVRELRLEVVSVQVDATLVGADRFSFVVNNGFDLANREFVKAAGKTLPEFFDFGSEVTISLGYGDKSGLELMLTGIVTELRASFPSSGLPQLTVSGYDKSFCLGRGTQSDSWQDRKDSDVVRAVAARYHLTPRVEDTSVKHSHINWSQESAAQFLTRLAERNGFEWLVRFDDLLFRNKANDEKGVVDLAWGKGLVSFTPEISIGEQVTEVEVHGWDVQNKRAIVGRARKGDEPGRDATRPSGTKRASGAENLRRVCQGEAGTLRVREPVFSRQEADRRARAILARRAEGFVGGRGESIGIPDLRPNVNVRLRGLGDMFDSTFYIESATHTVDASGYRTSFEVKDVTL